ncbi:uncharacterized protein LOC126967399 isoform X4 [Leptidea sinapis]|uniref:uncharacterized protein LOC126967399 isoform X3 n=1 Tax=Leptidea sinapis TaxID=189913 RepID=UPI002137EA54|nr:uncharacterized protein LOC126967399 isoform X3 [Leptidea sinapis]XP_050667804.1 uncharacterized protein LOC126967399 isoform X4 [Leptidea sinapis]
MFKYYICVILLATLLERSFQTDVLPEEQDLGDEMKGMKPKGPNIGSDPDPTHPGRGKGGNNGRASNPKQDLGDEMKGMKPKGPNIGSDPDPTHPGRGKGGNNGRASNPNSDATLRGPP